MCTKRTTSQRGFTLFELLLLIVVFAIGLAGILVVYNTTIVRSADPMVRKHVMAVAESMLEEILLQSFADPGGGPETGRTDFDNVADYNGYSSSGVYTIDGNAIAGLNNYDVAVSVTQVGVGGVPAADSYAVTVTVTGPAGISYALTGYKLNY